MDTPDPRDPALVLAGLLRHLRLEGLAGRPVPQKDLARALGVSPPLVSSWESGSAPTIPPQHRIEAYAQFFATERSLDNGRYRLVPIGELTATEEARRRELEADLKRHRSAALGGTLSSGSTPQTDDRIGEGPWRFANAKPVTIVCAPLPEDLFARMPYTDPDAPDFTRLYTLADVDSLLELHGHIRASNPDIRVNVRSAAELEPDDYTTHLVLLGGVDWNRITRHVLEAAEVPVRQHSFLEDPEGAAFEVDTHDGPRQLRPVLREEGGKQVLVEDVAHFYRAPNPYNRRRTVTVCNGMFGRGTLGAVRTLTDANFRDRNWAFLREQFRDGDTYSIMTRVQIVEGQVLTPDWTIEGTVLHLWPEAGE